MRHILIILLLCLVSGGCHTGRSASERIMEKNVRNLADSIKYSALKDGFENGEFVFRISYYGNKKVNSVDNWIILSNGEMEYQITPHIQPGGYTSLNTFTGDIKKIKKKINTKKHTVTVSGTAIFRVYPVQFSFTLYEGSNKGYGSISGFVNLEGWFETVGESDLVKGWQFRKRQRF